MLVRIILVMWAIFAVNFCTIGHALADAGFGVEELQNITKVSKENDDLFTRLYKGKKFTYSGPVLLSDLAKLFGTISVMAEGKSVGCNLPIDDRHASLIVSLADFIKNSQTIIINMTGIIDSTTLGTLYLTNCGLSGKQLNEKVASVDEWISSLSNAGSISVDHLAYAALTSYYMKGSQTVNVAGKTILVRGMIEAKRSFLSRWYELSINQGNSSTVIQCVPDPGSDALSNLDKMLSHDIRSTDGVISGSISPNSSHVDAIELDNCNISEISVRGKIDNIEKQEAELSAAAQRQALVENQKSELIGLNFQSMYTSHTPADEALRFAQTHAEILLVPLIATSATGIVAAHIGAVSGLTGAAAASHGLAMVGGLIGGSMVAGDTMLHLVFDFGFKEIGNTIIQGIDRFDKTLFHDRSSSFMSIPYPIDRIGDDRYVKALKMLDSLNSGEPPTSPFNLRVHNAVLDEIYGATDAYKLNTLSAIIYSNLGKYDDCVRITEGIIEDAKVHGVAKDNLTLVVAMNSLCMLGSPTSTLASIHYIDNSLDIALRNELNASTTQYFLQWLASYLDRYSARNDLLDASIFRRLISYATFIKDGKTQYQYVMITLGRYNLKLNELRSIIMGMREKRMPDSEISAAISRYQALLSIGNDAIEAIAVLGTASSYSTWSKLFQQDEINAASDVIKSLRGSIIKHRDSASEL